MNKRISLFLVVALAMMVMQAAHAQQNLRLTLQDVIDLAKSQSPASLQAETRKENSYWNFRTYKAQFNPQVVLSGRIPQYSRDFSPITQPDGSIDFRSRVQNFSDLELGVQQALPFSGGTISVNSSVSRFDNFDTDETRWNGVPINVRLSQPILGYNRFKWDKKIEPLRYEESKRNYVQQLEEISRFVTGLFFDYLEAQINLEIAEKNLANTKEIYQIAKNRYDIGTVAEDELLNIELQMLTSDQAVAQSKLDIESSALALKSYIGINEETNLQLVIPDNIPEFSVNVDRAIEQAKNNRAEYIAFERRITEAESDIAQARAQRYNINMQAQFGYNNTGIGFNDIYLNPQNQQIVSLGFQFPIIDWGRNKARMASANANKELTEYTVAQERVNFEQDIFTLVKNFEMLKSRLAVSQKSDEIGQKRFDLTRNRYLIGKVDIINLNQAQTEKDQARRNFIDSIRTYWQAYYDLRIRTLYDFENDQILFSNEDFRE